MSEWIEHDGGACPVAGDEVWIRFRDGDERRCVPDEMRWDHWGGCGDIVAYRVVDPAPQAQMLDEKSNRMRDMLDGLPQAHMMSAPTINCDAVPAIQHYEVCAERDELRAEVERLRKAWDWAYQQAMDNGARALSLQLDNERLRKGRDDKQSDVGSVAGNADVHDIRRSVGYQLVRMVADTLDPRLGTPQPDGEPVAPMSSRKAYRWGMV